jgi:RND superfamily putative drug exporter
MFELIAAQVNRRGILIVLAWLAFAVFLYQAAPTWRTVSRDDDVRFFPDGYPTVIGQDLLERGFPRDVSSSSFVIVGERPDGPLTADDLAYLDRLADRFAGLREAEPTLGIKGVTDRRTPIVGPRLIASARNGPGQAALVNVALSSTYVSKQARETVDRFEQVLAKVPAPPAGMTLATTGSAAVGHDMNTASNRSIEATTWTTIVLVVAILLVVYRSPLLAMIPLATIALSVFIALKLIASMTYVPWLNFQVINVTQVFVVVVLFGAGTDYCLFLIARYREELARGRNRDDALREAITQVGGALVASAGTVIIGLGMLYFSTFAKIQYTGPAIALSLAIALVASLTLAPVLLHWLRNAVFWPFKAPHHEAGRDPEAEGLEQAPALGLWTWVADQVVKYPGQILAVCLLALAPLAIVGIGTRPNYSQTADLRPTEPSILGTRVVQKYFAAGELGPSTILVAHPERDFRSEEGVRAIEAFAKEVALVPNVAEVRAVSRPLGRPLGAQAAAAAAAPPPADEGFLQRLNRLRLDAQRTAAMAALRAGADPRYVSTAPVHAEDRNRIARVEVIFRSDPFTAESMRTLERVHQVALEQTRPGKSLAGATAVGLGGSTAMVNDLASVTTKDERQMYVLVTLGVYAILVVLLRRPGISLYLIFTVILGYLASLGLTELVFRSLHTGPEPWGGLDWKVGFFLFVILVAVGEDYNIFLMARVLEEERRHGPIEGTRRAVAHTGGIISSCGLIMAGTFGSMLTGTLTSLQELGFALGVGVLLDTFIVRPVLVPAFVILWHRVRPEARLESAGGLGHHDAHREGTRNGDVSHAADAEPSPTSAG